MSLDQVFTTQARQVQSGTPIYAATVSRIVGSDIYVHAPDYSDYEYGPVALVGGSNVIVGQQCLLIFDADNKAWAVTAGIGSTDSQFTRLATLEIEDGQNTGQYGFDQVAIPSQPQPDSFTSLVERDNTVGFDGNASLHCKVSKPVGGGTSTGYGYARGQFENPISGDTGFKVGQSIWCGAAFRFATGYFAEKTNSSDILRLDAYVTDGGALRPLSDQQHLALEMFGDDTLRVVANDRNGNIIEMFDARFSPSILGEGTWHFIELHAILSPNRGEARTELYIDNTLMGSSDRQNYFSNRQMFNRIRYGIVSTGGGETGTLELWVDRAYAGARRATNRILPGAPRGHRLQYETTEQPQRSILKFSGAGVVAVDDPTNDTTGIVISGSGGTTGTVDPTLPTNAKAHTMQRELATDTVSLGASGRLQLSGPIKLKAGTTYSAVHFFNGNTAGASLTHKWGCLVRISDRKIVAVSADDTSATTTVDATLDYTFSSAYTPTGDEDVMAGLVIVGTTLPNLRGRSGSTAIWSTVLPMVAATADNGLTTPLAVNTVVAAFSGTSVKPYAWLT